MYWNYRLIETSEGRWIVRQVLYEDGEIVGYWARPTGPHGNDRDEVLEDLDRIMRASFTHHLEEEELENITKLPVSPRNEYEWKENE